MADFKPRPSPDGCVDVIEHERRLTADADELERAGLELLNSNVKGSRRTNLATAKELMLAAVRARSKAAEFASLRMRRDWIEHLQQEQRRLRLGAHTLGRAPLKRRQ